MMRTQQFVRGDRAVKVHLVTGDPNLKMTGTACQAFAANQVPTTTDPNQVTCAACKRQGVHR